MKTEKEKLLLYKLCNFKLIRYKFWSSLLLGLLKRNKLHKIEIVQNIYIRPFFVLFLGVHVLLL